MPNHNYGAEDHQKVWETWVGCKNWKKVAEITGLSYYTIRNWAKPEFDCPDACQYHDYEKLNKEITELRKNRNKLLAQGNNDIVDHHETAIKTLKGEEEAMKLASIDDSPAFQVFRKDEQRLGDVYSLWERIMYQITEQPVDPKLDTPAHEQKFMQRGMQVRNLKEGVQCLRDLHSMMQEIKGAERPDAKKETKKSPFGGLSNDQLMDLVNLAKTKPQIIVDAQNVNVK